MGRRNTSSIDAETVQHPWESSGIGIDMGEKAGFDGNGAIPVWSSAAGVWCLESNPISTI